MVDIPPELAKWVAGLSAEPVTLGLSSAQVWAMRDSGSTEVRFYLKRWIDRAAIRAEYERAHWLAGQSALFPGRPVVLHENKASAWMLTEALPGTPLHDLSGDERGAALSAAATSLKALHALPVDTCPFPTDLDTMISVAERHVRDGLVDTSDFDDVRMGRTPESLLDELKSRRPESEARAVCHGDACLPNLIWDGGSQCGMVDLGRLGISDPWRDLAYFMRSVASNWGEEWIMLFAERYGVAYDEELFDYYCLLDEFF